MDYKTLKINFLKHYERPATRRSYLYGLNVLEKYTESNHLNILNFTHKNAAAFIDEISENRKTADIRMILTSCSSFFNFLSGEKIIPDNPFRGLRKRPPKQNSKEILVPAKEEVSILINETTPEMGAVFACLSYAGLTPSSIFALTIKDGNKFSTEIHGKEFAGTFSDEIMKCIREMLKYYDSKGDLAYNPQTPFALIPPEKIENRVIYWTRKFKESGKIRAAYSANAFRHFYAEMQFSKDGNIENLSKQLNHARVSVTVKYLKDRKFI